MTELINGWMKVEPRKMGVGEERKKGRREGKKERGSMRGKRANRRKREGMIGFYLNLLMYLLSLAFGPH